MSIPLFTQLGFFHIIDAAAWDHRDDGSLVGKRH